MLDSYQGTCFRMPTRTIKASRRAATTAHSSSEMRRFAGASLGVLISFSLSQIQNTLVIVVRRLVQGSGKVNSPNDGIKPPHRHTSPPALPHKTKDPPWESPPP